MLKYMLYDMVIHMPFKEHACILIPLLTEHNFSKTENIVPWFVGWVNNYVTYDKLKLF